MRTVVVDALGRIGRPPASALLMEALDDRRPAVRVRAIEALSRLGTRGLARRLADIVRSDHSPDVRRIAEVAPARAGSAMRSRNREPRIPGTRHHRVGLPLLRDLSRNAPVCTTTRTAETSLAERLAPLAIDRGFRSYLDLYYLLKYEDDPADWARVMDALSVPETYFWREIDQIRAVVDRGRARSCRQRRRAPLRIWSVPCATGEEPLTIAMVLERRAGSTACAHRNPRQRCQPGGARRAPAGRYRRPFVPRAAGLAEGEILRADGGGWRPIASLASRMRPGRWST